MFLKITSFCFYYLFKWTPWEMYLNAKNVVLNMHYLLYYFTF